jgi:hypothetical protein
MLQQQITGSMTVPVVDRLEPVEVDDQQAGGLGGEQGVLDR